MSILTTRAERRQLERENAKRPLRLEAVPRDQWHFDWTARHAEPTAVWRSRDFLVTRWEAREPALCRLSILRTRLQGERWADGITWDDLQRLKNEAGYSDAWAVELFPADTDVVNVANIRHLWILERPPAFAWTGRPSVHTNTPASSPSGGTMGAEQPAAAGLNQGGKAA